MMNYKFHRLYSDKNHYFFDDSFYKIVFLFLGLVPQMKNRIKMSNLFSATAIET